MVGGSVERDGGEKGRSCEKMEADSEDTSRQVSTKEGLRDCFGLAANSLTVLYKRSLGAEQEGRLAGAREAFQLIHEWASENRGGSGTVPVRELLDLCRAQFTDHGGNPSDLKTEGLEIKTLDEDVNGPYQADEDKQSSEVLGKLNKDIVGKDKDCLQMARCPRCLRGNIGTTALVNVAAGRKRGRLEADVDGDNELSQLFVSKLGSPWANRGPQTSLPESPDNESDHL